MEKTEYNKRYWIANRERLRKQNKQYFAANREQLIAKQRERYQQNKERAKAYARQWVLDNPEKAKEVQLKSRRKNLAQLPENAARLEKIREGVRRRTLKFKYGMSIKDFEAMAEAQNYQCAVCKTKDPGGRGVWHVDHCHNSNAVRGLLCWRCNVTLGNAKDDIELLRAMADYLERFR